MRLYCFIFSIICMLVSCQSSLNPIEKVLQSPNPKIKTVVENLDAHEVQILFTEIAKDGENIVFKDFEYNNDSSSYFYPASSVKLPIAILALEKLKDYPSIDKNTPFRGLQDSLKTTIEKEVQKIFAVSDNVAYNKLFDFLGYKSINDSLESKGLNARISHKLSTGDQEMYPVNFFDGDSTILAISNKEAVIEEPLGLKKLHKGIGYIKGDSLINEPMDFSQKNYLPINTLHSIVKRIMFPEMFTKEERFDLSESNRDFLLKSMKSLPKDAGYISDEYYDSYVKFLVFGDDKRELPESVSIYNKVGYAYGYLTDSAYIVDNKSNKSFIITATVHVNKNGIYNDGVYEYETIGIPFLAELGRQLTQISLD